MALSKIKTNSIDDSAITNAKITPINIPPILSISAEKPKVAKDKIDFKGFVNEFVINIHIIINKK